MSDRPVGPEWPDEAAAERLLARFRYGADADAASNGAQGPNIPNHQNTPNTADSTAAAATGRPAGPAEGRSAEVPDTLERVLAAAAAPAQPHELRGYDAARRAFEAAGAMGGSAVAGGAGLHGSRSRGRHVASGPLARLAGVKIAALAGALTVAGVAVAAEADVLPSPIQRAAHRMLGGVGVPDPEPAGQDPVTSASSGPGGSPTGAHASHSSAQTLPTHASTAGGPGLPSATAGSALPDAHPDATSGDEAVDLCRAYVSASSGNGNGGGNAMPPGQRRRLADLAGGDQYIDAFCAKVLAAAPSSAPASAVPTTPSPSAAVSTGPGNPGRTHPTHDPRTDPTSPNGNGNGNGNVTASVATKKH